jgi:hypothetical protein
MDKAASVMAYTLPPCGIYPNQLHMLLHRAAAP